nr:unnamed protein product [Digitaria exilis]
MPVEEMPDPFLDLPILEQPLVIGDGAIDGVVTHGDGEGVNTMDQSPTEWSFESLLEEELLADAPIENSTSSSALPADPVVEVDHAAMSPMQVSVVGNPMEYNTVLKRKLEEDLATVGIYTFLLTGLITGNMNLMKNKSMVEGPINHARDAYIRARLATCSSSRDPSPSDDDDDMDGEVEILGFRMPTEEKMRRRKESNRESARRSRYRKAAHLKEMEDQVAQLRVENTSLLRRLAVLNQKCTDATVDNRVLKADMETLRAKVKMAEDALNRVTGMSSSQPSRPILAPTNADASGPILDNIINYLMNATDATTNNNFVPRMMAPALPQAEMPASGNKGTSNDAMINRIAAHHAVAVELLHKRLGSMPTSSEAAPLESAPSGVDESIDDIDTMH